MPYHSGHEVLGYLVPQRSRQLVPAATLAAGVAALLTARKADQLLASLAPRLGITVPTACQR